jgi:hypothetical protein
MGKDDGKLRPFSPKSFTIETPTTRSPDNPDPNSARSHNGNYTSSDKDFSKFGSSAPSEINQLHTRSDVDASPQAQHHTLGFQHNQAAIGDHTHDGTTSRPIGYKLGTVLTGAKGGNVALTNLIAMLKNFIDFTDNTT